MKRKRGKRRRSKNIKGTNIKQNNTKKTVLLKCRNDNLDAHECEYDMKGKYKIGNMGKEKKQVRKCIKMLERRNVNAYDFVRKKGKHRHKNERDVPMAWW